VILLLAFLAMADPSMMLSKKFPGSKPEYAEVRISMDGQVEYRESPEEDPYKFKMSAEDTAAVFQLAEKLDKFKRELESGLKVARMGEKTFRWEQNGQTSEVKFNYSTDVDAQALLDWYERMCESAYHYFDLEKAAKFDKLGVNQAILKLEAAWDKKRLVAVDQYLPLLDRVAKNDAYLNMARERAARLAAAFRESPAPKAKVE